MKNPSMSNASGLVGDVFLRGRRQGGGVGVGKCRSNPHFISLSQDEKVILANLNPVIKLLFQKHGVN